jgi:hypothetical protein
MRVLWRGTDCRIAILALEAKLQHAEARRLADNVAISCQSPHAHLWWRTKYLQEDLLQILCKVRTLEAIQQAYNTETLFFRVRYWSVHMAPVHDWTTRLETALQLLAQFTPAQKNEPASEPVAG